MITGIRKHCAQDPKRIALTDANRIVYVMDPVSRYRDDVAEQQMCFSSILYGGHSDFIDAINISQN